MNVYTKFYNFLKRVGLKKQVFMKLLQRFVLSLDEYIKYTPDSTI